jgi:hypothetical protein
MAVDVLVDTDSLHQSSSRSRSITAAIWWRANETTFPAERWSDFAVVVLGWWIEAALELLDCGGTTVFRFMDGPFGVRASAPSRSDTWVLGFERNDKPWDRSPGQVIAAREGIIRGLHSAGVKMLEACEKKRIESPDLMSLRALLSRLGERVG